MPNDQKETVNSPSDAKNEDFGKALETGLAAIQNLFDGIVTAAKKAVGPEMLRNFEAANWIGRVATCLEETAAAFRDAPTALAGKSGELACHLERLDAEVKASKFESQQSALRQRLDGVVQAIAAGPSAAASQKTAEAAGYFRAAANSVGPVPTGNGDTFNVKVK